MIGPDLHMLRRGSWCDRRWRYLENGNIYYESKTWRMAKYTDLGVTAICTQIAESWD